MLATPAHRPAATLGIVAAQARRASARSRRISVAWAGPVPRRVAALLAPPPRTRVLLLALAVLVVLAAGVSALGAAWDLHALLKLADGTH
jgi:hypothetical protein